MGEERKRNQRRYGTRQLTNKYYTGDMNEELDNQVENKPLRNEKGQLLPGQTANPYGRPKGKTLKEYQAERFRQMTDEEKEEYLRDVAKVERWRMAEGNPEAKTDITSLGEKIVFLPAEVINNLNEPTPEAEGDSTVG